MTLPHRCCLTMAGKHDDERRPCTRTPVYRISYVGSMCQYHFERYLTTHMVDPEDCSRLSDNENDFVVRTEPGKGHSGNYKMVAKGANQ